MDYSGASSYIYAKACGMLSKTFTGKNAAALFNVRSLAEIWDLLFKEPVPQLPEQLLANKIEHEAVKKFVSQYISLLRCYSKPDPFLVELLRRYDILNLKVLAAASINGEQERPRVIRIDEYSELDYDSWPDMKKITAMSSFAWYGNMKPEEDHQQMDFKLDLQEIRFLWKAVNHVADSSRKSLVEYYRRFYSIKNMLWAMRLKVYYNMKAQDIEKNLFYVTEAPSSKDPICGFAYEILNMETDSYNDWASWRFAAFLNPHEEGAVWTVDPMWVEQKFRFGEIKEIKRMFYGNPMTYASLVAFFLIKLKEIDCIRAATESIRLNASIEDAMYGAGVSSNEN